MIDTNEQHKTELEKLKNKTDYIQKKSLKQR